MTITDLMEEAVDALLYFGRFDLSEAAEKLADLVTKAAAGDRDAFAALMRRLEPKLRAVIKARSRGSLQPADVDDVLQSVWVEVFEKGVLQKLNSPEGVVPMLNAIAKNMTLNAAQLRARQGATSRRAAIAPGATGVAKPGRRRGGGQLSSADKKIVRKAVTRGLAKAKLAPDERMFIAMAFGLTPGGEAQLPDYGSDVERAKKVGKTGNDKTLSAWSSRVKRRFLRHFCTDKELCDLLPSGRSRSRTNQIPGLGQNACKNVKDSCVEDEVVAFAHRLGALTEGHPQNVEGEATELVLSWLTETLAGA